ncbi:hypothetical protein DWY50_07025 [Ruminococcus sp. AF25-28AC]|nr:hypothetical protein DWY50_07025 [Ruminococcus sp. AF25-28AC]
MQSDSQISERYSHFENDVFGLQKRVKYGTIQNNRNTFYLIGRNTQKNKIWRNLTNFSAIFLTKMTNKC